MSLSVSRGLFKVLWASSKRTSSWHHSCAFCSAVFSLSPGKVWNVSQIHLHGWTGGVDGEGGGGGGGGGGGTGGGLGGGEGCTISGGGVEGEGGWGGGLGAEMHVSTSLKTPGVTSVLTSLHANPTQHTRAPEQSSPPAMHGASLGSGGGGGTTTLSGGGEGGGKGLGGLGGRDWMVCGGEGGGKGLGGGDGLRALTEAPLANKMPSRSPPFPLGTRAHASHARRPMASNSMRRRHPRLAQPHVVFLAATCSSASLSASRSASSGTSITRGTSLAPVGTLRPPEGFHDSKVRFMAR